MHDAFVGFDVDVVGVRVSGLIWCESVCVGV